VLGKALLDGVLAMQFRQVVQVTVADVALLAGQAGELFAEPLGRIHGGLGLALRPGAAGTAAALAAGGGRGLQVAQAALRLAYTPRVGM
jgi:hypothetical protein